MPELPLDDAQRALDTLFEGMEASRGPAVAAIAERKSLRMARLAAAGVRLEEQLGSEDDQVRELKDGVSHQDGLRVALNARGERERRRPRVAPMEWLAYGQVLHRDGTPAVGLRVQLLDRDRKYDDLLGDTRTDDFGDWVIGPYHARDFFEEGEDAPELYVKVYGARGRLLFSGEKDGRFAAGQVEYFDIVLPPGKSSNGRAS